MHVLSFRDARAGRFVTASCRRARLAERPMAFGTEQPVPERRVLLQLTELRGVEKDAVTDRTRLDPDARLCGVNHADHLDAVSGTCHARFRVLVRIESSTSVDRLRS